MACTCSCTAGIGPQNYSTPAKAREDQAGTQPRPQDLQAATRFIVLSCCILFSLLGALATALHHPSQVDCIPQSRLPPQAMLQPAEPVRPQLAVPRTERPCSWYAYVAPTQS